MSSPISISFKEYHPSSVKISEQSLYKEQKIPYHLRIKANRKRLQPSKFQLTPKQQNYFKELTSLRKKIKRITNSLEISHSTIDPDVWIAEQLLKRTQALKESSKKNYHSIQAFQEFYDSGFDFYRDQLDFAFGITGSLSKVISTLKIAQNSKDTSFKNLGQNIELALAPPVIASQIINFSQYGFKYALLGQANTKLEILKTSLKYSSSPSVIQEVKELEIWIEKQKKALKQEIALYTLVSMGDIPNIIRAVLEASGNLSKATSSGLLLTGGGLNLILSSYALYKAVKEEHTIDILEKKLDPNILHIDTTTQDKKKIKEAQKKIIDHIAKNREQFNSLKVKFYPKANNILAKMRSLKDFKKISIYLKNEHIDITILNARRERIGKHSITTIEDLEDPITRDLIVEQLAQRTQTIQVSTKNALQTFVKEKYKLSKSFFSFKTKRNILGFILSVSSLVILSLKVVGVIAGVASAATGFGLIGLGLLLLASGTYYYYKHHKNLFKEKMRSDYIKMTLHNIPIAFKNWRLQINKANLIKKQLELNQECFELSSQVHKLEGEHDNEELLKGIQYKTAPFDPIKAHKNYIQLLKQRQKENLNIDTLKKIISQKKETFQIYLENESKKIKKQEEEIKVKENKYKHVEKSIKEALWKDYIEMLREKNTGSRVAPPNSSNDYETFILKLPALLSQMIVNGTLDPASKSILEKQIGITLPETDNLKVIQKEITDGMKLFFGLETQNFYRFVTATTSNIEPGRIALMGTIEEYDSPGL